MHNSYCNVADRGCLIVTTLSASSLINTMTSFQFYKPQAKMAYFPIPHPPSPLLYLRNPSPVNGSRLYTARGHGAQITIIVVKIMLIYAQNPFKSCYTKCKYKLENDMQIYTN